ncbi:MAG: ligand-gated channel protein, partial [Proteobacteria bacterium]|nr:ligand-gated channel protein [Pseudomonadota bacterium]
TFYPGLRVDYFSPVNDLAFEPRPGVRYAVSPDLTLLASGGLYAQPPEERQYSTSYGNPAIQGSRVWQLKLGAEKDLSAELRRGSEAYSGVFGRWFRDLVIPDTSTLFSNEGSGRAIGWENSLKATFDPWNFWISYTLSRSTRWDPDHPDYLYQYDQTHFLTLIAGVNLSPDWRISGRFRYVTGPLQTLPQTAVGDLDNDVFIPVRGSLYNSRLDPFTMLDIRVDKTWIYDTWKLSLYLDILNVLSRQNVEGLQYSYDYSQSETVKGFPILPTFGLKGEF